MTSISHIRKFVALIKATKNTVQKIINLMQFHKLVANSTPNRVRCCPSISVLRELQIAPAQHVAGDEAVALKSR